MPTLYETMIKIGVDTSEIDSGMSKAEGAVGGFGSTIKGVFGGNLLYGAVTKVGGAVMNFAKSSIHAGMSFDSAMSQVQATMLKHLRRWKMTSARLKLHTDILRAI